MPEILEMKREGDDFWVRVPSKFLSLDSDPVSLYYQSEIDQVRRMAYEAAIRCIDELANPPTLSNGEL